MFFGDGSCPAHAAGGLLQILGVPELCGSHGLAGPGVQKVVGRLQSAARHGRRHCARCGCGLRVGHELAVQLVACAESASSAGTREGRCHVRAGRRGGRPVVRRRRVAVCLQRQDVHVHRGPTLEEAADAAAAHAGPMWGRRGPLHYRRRRRQGGGIGHQQLVAHGPRVASAWYEVHSRELRLILGILVQQRPLRVLLLAAGRREAFALP
mmetsp:Transcript_33827/g.102232  ORF Transcript_33827/g.102232 Transcript_33827/m.102232 type:complete len:210 (+) Transcript_33827:932-1561(+)